MPRQNQRNNQNNPCRKEPIDAPYNFVPLADKIVTPSWAEQVSHDLPFKDGISGEIHYTLTAHSPLLVGGEQIAATANAPGKVSFFTTPDNKFAIPGSSIKGMIRSVLEIATFSRMSMVDDKRYGLRDISGKYVSDAYTSRVRNRVQTGFLQLSSSGEPEITPCEMARLSHRDLEEWWHINDRDKPIFKTRLSVKKKYDHWEKLCHKQGIKDPFCIPFAGAESASQIGSGALHGFPVLTGQISAEDPKSRKFGQPRKGREKYRDFIFHSPRSADAIPLHGTDQAAWRDFLFIHGDEDGKQDMPWTGFWKARFWRKQQVPVFYIRNGNRLQIGLAYMPKLAGDFSIHDMIGHTTKAHLTQTEADFATLLFGQISDQPENALKGRVQFEIAPAKGDPQPIKQSPSIQSSPKPTYFPNYICQNASTPGWRLNGGDKAQYATYLETPQNPKPKLRGWKRYPTRPDKEVEIQKPFGPDQERNNKVQMQLNPLPGGATFAGRLLYHNLKPEELGALLWSLDFGGKSNCRHSLGLGKSFGFGQVTLAVDKEQSQLNNPAASTLTSDEYINQFTLFMDENLGYPWQKSIQINILQTMADPAQRSRFKGKLKHMVLASKKKINDFHDAKKSAQVLGAYTPLTASSDSLSISIKKEAVWSTVNLSYKKDSQEITAYQNGETAFARGTEASLLFKTLTGKPRKLLEKNRLKANLTLEHCGGKNYKIIKLEPA